MAKRTYDYLFKLLLIGDSSVGKTSIVFRFADDTFSPTFISTIGIDFRIKTIEMRGKKIKLQIWDTAGQERFNAITKSYYHGAMGILMVYDITNPTSFNNLTKWLRNILENANDDVQKMVLGNKCDMEEQRRISKERGEAIAKENRIMFLEISAKTNVNVEEAFLRICESILDTIPDASQHSTQTVPLTKTKNNSSSNCCSKQPISVNAAQRQATIDKIAI